MLEDQQASNKNGLHRKERFEIGVQDAVGYQKVYRNSFPSVSHVVYHLGPIHPSIVIISIEVQLQEVVLPPANLDLPERPGYGVGWEKT